MTKPTERIEDALRNMLVLYKRRISDRVMVRIVQIHQTESDFEHTNSQFLALVIEDEKTGRWISLRLSTFRKVIKFVGDMNFSKARHLLPDEVRNLQGKEIRREG